MERPPVTRQEYEELKSELDKAVAQLAVQQTQLAAQIEQSADTNTMVKSLHAALMLPTPGQKRSLLDRMATVTITIESGGRVGRVLVWIGALLSALGVIVLTIRGHGP